MYKRQVLITVNENPSVVFNIALVNPFTAFTFVNIILFPVVFSWPGSLTKIDRSAYAALPNKLSQGTPSQYYVQRTYSPSIFLYQTPGSGFSSQSTPSNYQLRFYYLARIEDAGKYTNTPDVVFRFLPCLTSGLAYYLSITYRPEKTEMLKLVYEDELQRALQEDGQRTSLFISPKTFYGDGV